MLGRFHVIVIESGVDPTNVGRSGEPGALGKIITRGDSSFTI